MQRQRQRQTGSSVAVERARESVGSVRFTTETCVCMQTDCWLEDLELDHGEGDSGQVETCVELG